jgi:hypothetical protein
VAATFLRSCLNRPIAPQAYHRQIKSAIHSLQGAIGQAAIVETYGMGLKRVIRDGRTSGRFGARGKRFGRWALADPATLFRAMKRRPCLLTPSGEVSKEMPAKTVNAAIEELRNAIQSLEIAIDGRFDKEKDVSEFEGEVRRVNTDRSRLAQELDQSQFRANRLEEVNREVSRRLVTAMETIRAVLDR